jgi:hypothetical protein
MYLKNGKIKKIKIKIKIIKNVVGELATNWAD